MTTYTKLQITPKINSRRKVLDKLKAANSQAVPTLALAKACGFTTKSDVNPLLYDMQKQGLIKTIRPALWVLEPHPC